MDIPFHQEQLEFIVTVSKHRTDGLDIFFRFLNLFDTEYFFLIFIPLIWIGCSWRWGIRFSYLILLNGILNAIAKTAVGWPRPTMDLPEVGIYQFSSPGFPSGGAQTAFLLAGLLIYYWKNRWAWIFGGIYFLLISFSRIYLGVHFPIDILGGWALGALILYLFTRWVQPIEKFLASQNLLFCLALSEIIPLTLLFIQPLKNMGLATVLMGSGFGIYFSLKYKLYLRNPKTFLEGALRALFGIGGVFLLLFLYSKGFSPRPLYFTCGLWVSLAASPLYGLISKKSNR